MKRILKNAIRCKKCGEIIISDSVHTYVTCKCGACSVDGGYDYLRRCALSENDYIDLSEVEEVDNKKK